jgi:FHA domain
VKALVVTNLVLTALLLAGFTAFAVLMLQGRVSVCERAAEVPPPRPHESEGAGAKAHLLVLRGLQPNWQYPIYEGRNVIGRADAQPVDIDLQPEEAEDRIWSSRQHAAITCEGGALVIEDLNSSNGTFVNRSRVTPGERRPLKLDDIVQIGEVHLKVAR